MSSVGSVGGDFFPCCQGFVGDDELVFVLVEFQGVFPSGLSKYRWILIWHDILIIFLDLEIRLCYTLDS